MTRLVLNIQNLKDGLMVYICFENLYDYVDILLMSATE